ncbi:eCIS core domain-containing protein [Tessaracoccus sp.]
MAGRAHDAAERQASGSAERVAAGNPVGLRGAAARSPASPFGVALPGPLRRTMESSLGADLATVRIRDDGVAAGATRSAGALAVTVGEDIAFAPGHYRPDTAAGRLLIAHEVTHVVQQRTDGVRPQYQEVGPTTTPTPAEEPVWISASLHGLAVTSPGRLMPAGQSSQRAYLIIVLRRLAPTATAAQLDTLLESVITAPDLTSEGSIEPGRVIPKAERFVRVTIRASAFVTVAALMEQQGLAINLTADQRRVLKIGAAADEWKAEAVAILRRDFAWYTEALWQTQLDMHSQLLAEAVDAEAVAPAGTRPANGRDALIAAFCPPLEVLEATRGDQTLAQVPAGPETAATRGAAKGAGAWNVLWGPVGNRNQTSQERMRMLAIQFYWTAPTLYAPARTNRSVRSDFLRRLSNWMGRAAVTIDRAHDYTQELVRNPGRFTDQPFAAHLEAVPEPAGDLRIVPAHAEHRYRFSVDFHDVFDAFGHYAYRWDVLGWQPAEGGAAQAISDIEAGRTDAGTRTSGRRSTRHGDVLAARLGRDLAHARADVGKLAAELGPAAVTMAPAAMGLFQLRALSTAVRTLVDVVTLEHGAGVRERMIQLPGPGLWVIRAAAVPIFEEKDEVHRAPSIAYIPVYAVPQNELADQALADAIRAADTAERNRRDAQAVLSDLTAHDADPTLSTMAAKLSADPRLGADRWAALEAVQADLKSRLADIEASLVAGATPVLASDQVALLQAQRAALGRQVSVNADLLQTHRGRVKDHPDLATPQQLMISFVSDEGQTLPLAMEWAEQTRKKASLSVTATAGKGDKFVVLSDHTSPHGGMEEGSGATLDLAVRNAVKNVLESRAGYGRGLVAVRLPGGRSVSFRIEASLGQLFNEALDSATTLITVAALAAAPFTAGASLTILIPVGVIAGVRAAERMYARYDASTLRWDMQTLQDFVDIASAVVGVGSAVRGTRAGMQVSRMGRVAAISFDVAQNVTGFIILGVGLQEQLRAIDDIPGLSAGERRSRRAMVLGGALLSAGMQAGATLISHAYGSQRADGEPVGQPGDGTPPADSVPGAVQVTPAEGPLTRVTDPTTKTPAEVPETPAAVADRTPVPVSDGQRPAPVGDGQTPVPVSDGRTAVPVEVVAPLAPAADVAPPKTSPRSTPDTPRPRTVDDLLTPEGRFRPEYGDLRRAWDAYADQKRTRGQHPLTPREWALSQTRGGFARRLGDLLARGWRRGMRAVYPGARPRAVALDVPSPAPGTRVQGTSLRWTRRIVRTQELRPVMDAAGETFWSFPDLRAGEVLVLPNGSRIWIDPATGAIVDSNPVGPSISSQRGVTRGEEVMFAAGDRSQAHVDAGTQRLHGATSPGLGGDAPYSIVGGPRSLNLVIENAGIEAWVRALRTNAPPGVDYVFTTRTQGSVRGDLLSRSYSVGALEGGRFTPIADFEVRMRGGGITDADVDVPGWHVHPDGMERYGAPRLTTQPASRPPGGDVSVAMPDSLSRAVGGGTAADPRVVSSVTDPLEGAQQARARLGGLAERMLTTAAGPVELGERLFELDAALAGAETRIAHRPTVDPQALADLGAVVAHINEITRIRTRSDRIDLVKLGLLTRMLNGIAID